MLASGCQSQMECCLIIHMRLKWILVACFPILFGYQLKTDSWFLLGLLFVLRRPENKVLFVEPLPADMPRTSSDSPYMCRCRSTFVEGCSGFRGICCCKNSSARECVRRHNFPSLIIWLRLFHQQSWTVQPSSSHLDLLFLEEEILILGVSAWKP